jgi:hypothetical protein
MTAPKPVCPCGAADCPDAVTNPAGQSQISYRATDFSQIREALLQPLTGEQSLVGWNPAVGDLGLQMLEWWAYLGDVLTFYNERIANEDYLRTATFPSNIAGLVDLIGYQPKPGVAAIGQVAALRTVAHPNEPLVVPMGMGIASTATPGVPSQNFEVSATQTFNGPAQIGVAPYPNPAMVPNSNDNGPASVLLAGKVSGIKVGDPVLLVGKVTTVELNESLVQLQGPWQGLIDNWCYTTIAALTRTPDANTKQVNTLVTFASTAEWGTAGSPFNQSDQNVVSYELLKATQVTSLWGRPPPGNGGSVLSAGLCGPIAHLNDTVRSIVAGDLVLFDGSGLQVNCLEVVLGTAESTWYVTSPAPASGETLTTEGDSNTTTGVNTASNILYPHTALLLFGTETDATTILAYDDYNAIPVRYGFKPVGAVMAAPTQTIGSLPIIVEAPGTYTPPATTATAMLVDATGTGLLVNVTAGGTTPPVALPSGTIELTLAPVGSPSLSLPAQLQAPFQLLFDLVPVTRGTTVPSETLGSGDATQINQAFTLQKGPLTYVSSGSTIQSVLTVFVNNITWTQVPSFYGQSPTANVFVVDLDASGSATVTFGDGVNGARLPTGSGNVTATYSYGSGAASPPAGRLTTILRPQPNLASLQNPIAVSGGNDPQPPTAVKQDAPASIFTFGRAISALDYQVIAEQAAGVSQAQSVWSFNGQSQRTTVTVYVAGLLPTGASGMAALSAAQAALAGSEDPNRPVTVLVANPIPLTLSGTLVVADDANLASVFAAAVAVLTDPVAGPFSPEGCPIGSRLYRSQLDAALFVPGVVAVEGLTAINPGWCLTGSFSLGDYLDPGMGAYFALGNYSALTPMTVSAASSLPGGTYT